MALHSANPYAGMVCISKLPPALKRRAWLFIQEQRPELAAQLGVDKKTSVIGEFQRLFGAEVWIPIQDCGLTDEELRADPPAAPAGRRP